MQREVSNSERMSLLCKMDEVGGLAYWEGARVDTNIKGLVIGTLKYNGNDLAICT